jgi:uncharacterized protein
VATTRTTTSVPAATDERARFSPTERTRVRRLAQRGVYERDAIYAILDEGLVAHVGFVDRGEPFVLPMAYARVDDAIVLHGSTRARLLESMAGGGRVCVAVTLLDGVVLARSAFHHSMNYRSVTVLGEAQAVEDEGAKCRALEAFLGKVVPGRWGPARPPSAQELKATTVVAVPIDEVSAKVRTGGPLDDPEDMGRPVWAGVIPLALQPGDPEPDPRNLGEAPGREVLVRVDGAAGRAAARPAARPASRR